MAKHLGYANATEFALVVESMTQEQRRACLDTWYRERRELLLLNDNDEDEEEEERVKQEAPGEQDVKYENVKEESIKEEQILL
jgi:hypothetical protein